MQTTTGSKINQSDWLEYLEWKRFKDQGGSVTNLTNPFPAGHNLYCLDNNINQLGKGLCLMARNGLGKIRAVGRCNCGGIFEEKEVHGGLGKILICENCFSKGVLSFPSRYMLDIGKREWKGDERVRLTSDNDGEILKTLDQANDLLTEIRQKIKKDEFSPDQYQKKDYRKMAFDQYAKDFLLELREKMDAGEYAPASLDTVQLIINKYLIPAFKNKDIRKFRNVDIKKFDSKLKKETTSQGKNLSQLYRQNIIKKLRQLFKRALDDGYVKHDQIPKFPEIKHVEVEKNYCSMKEQDKIFQCIPTQHKPIFLFIRNTGCRTAEARSLHVSDIDFEKKEVTIRRSFSRGVLMSRPKEKKSKNIPLDDELYEMLSGLRKIVGLGFVFINPSTGGYYRKSTMENLWKGILRIAKAEYIKMHEWGRHSFITQCIEQGYDIYDIMKFVGHKKISTTEGYIHSWGNRLKKITRPARVIKLRNKSVIKSVKNLS